MVAEVKMGLSWSSQLYGAENPRMTKGANEVVVSNAAPSEEPFTKGSIMFIPETHEAAVKVQSYPDYTLVSAVGYQLAEIQGRGHRKLTGAELKCVTLHRGQSLRLGKKDSVGTEYFKASHI